jgi:hypothetical protein
MAAMADRRVISVSFTASRDLSQEAADGVVTNVLMCWVPHADRYVTGGCTGGDSFVGRWLQANRPGAEHVVVVPANRSRVDPWWTGVKGPVTVIEMPEGSTYADRNRRLVDEGTCLFGFPAYPEDDHRSRRSGSWQAIRMARRDGKLSQWHCLTPPYEGRIVTAPASLLAGRHR